MGNILSARWNKSDPKDRRFSSASSRQQKIIIKQLRETQHRKKKSIKTKKYINKIVPIAVLESKSNSNENSKRTSSALNSRDDRKRSKEGSSRISQKCSQHEVDTSVPKADTNMPKAELNDLRDANEELNLKAALTHPTISKFLRDFMRAQNSCNLLDFYLDAVEIRCLNSGRYYKEAYELYLSVTKKYILENATDPINLSPRFKEMIAGTLLNPRKISSTEVLLGVVTKRKLGGRFYLGKKVLEGLLLAQYEALFAISMDSWRPFCESDIFSSLLLKKEIRTTLVLERPRWRSEDSSGFASIMGSDKASILGSSSRKNSECNNSLGFLMSSRSKSNTKHHSFTFESRNPSLQVPRSKSVGYSRRGSNHLIASVRALMGTSAQSAQQQPHPKYIQPALPNPNRDPFPLRPLRRESSPLPGTPDEVIPDEGAMAALEDQTIVGMSSDVLESKKVVNGLKVADRGHKIEIANPTVKTALVRASSFFEDEFNMKSNSEGDINVFNFSRSNLTGNLNLEPIHVCKSGKENEEIDVNTPMRRKAIDGYDVDEDNVYKHGDKEEEVAVNTPMRVH